MNVTLFIRQLKAVGFTEENLDRAIALAGANRLAYQMLHHAVTSRGLSPADALRSLESDTNIRLKQDIPCGIIPAMPRCRPWRASARLRPPPCLAKILLARLCHF